jgi:hypothetical protein
MLVTFFKNYNMRLSVKKKLVNQSSPLSRSLTWYFLSLFNRIGMYRSTRPDTNLTKPPTARRPPACTHVEPRELSRIACLVLCGKGEWSLGASPWRERARHAPPAPSMSRGGVSAVLRCPRLAHPYQRARHPYVDAAL